MSNDPKLGWEVHKHLKSLGIETPAQFSNPDSATEPEFVIADHFDGIMQTLGLDLGDDSLAGTPARVAKMYVRELFTGLDYINFPKCTAVANKMKCDELVICSDIEIKSCCEHHWQPIIGKAAIGYLPKDKVLGLSKLNRVAQFFARRPQVQERMTSQIYEALSYILGTSDIAVVIRADHFCVKMRGVEDNSNTVTSKMGGRFMSKPEARAEFLALARI
jgi:GTP cyclohydrolase I